MRHRLRSQSVIIAVLALSVLSGCGKRYVAGTTPQQAMAYELNEAVTFLRSAQTKVIAAVDANPSIKPQADKFLNPVRDAFVLAQTKLVPLLESYDAAVKLGDEAKRLKLSSDIKPLLTEFNRLVGTAFGAQLPSETVTAISDFVAKVNSILTTLRTEFNIGGTQ